MEKGKEVKVESYVASDGRENSIRTMFFSKRVENYDIDKKGKGEGRFAKSGLKREKQRIGNG